MALVYGILGLVVILTAGSFGTINASPWFNVGIAALFVVLGLAMFDVLAIDFSRLQSRFTTGTHRAGSFLVAFGMGAVAALLAGACVAPVVIQVIVFSSNLYGTGTTAALALPFVLGIGMALPWPVAGAGLSWMPKPGAWMVHVKHAFGVFILGTAVYYGYVGYGLFAQRWVDPEEVANSVQALLDEGWHASLGRGLAAAKAENKLVLVDMWATWCKNCLTMDRTTLKAPEVEAGLETYVKVKFQAEDLDASPARDVLKHLDGIGLPTYAILRPRSDAPIADAGGGNSAADIRGARQRGGQGCRRTHEGDRTVTERFRNILLVVAPVLAACAVQPGEVNLASSFGEQLAAVDGVTDFVHDGNELTFMGPDGRGGIASWRVQMESTELVSNEGRPLEGHVVSSWYRDGERIEPDYSIGMSMLPNEFVEVGIAQVCYALWDEAESGWDW